MIRAKYSGLAERCEINEVLNAVPAVDAVPVVRCKDCKYWMRVRELRATKSGCCRNIHGKIAGYCFPEENYFCPDGERRDSE